jgi:hypothetical protein
MASPRPPSLRIGRHAPRLFHHELDRGERYPKSPEPDTDHLTFQSHIHDSNVQISRWCRSIRAGTHRLPTAWTGPTTRRPRAGVWWAAALSTTKPLVFGDPKATNSPHIGVPCGGQRIISFLAISDTRKGWNEGGGGRSVGGGSRTGAGCVGLGRLSRFGWNCALGRSLGTPTSTSTSGRLRGAPSRGQTW